MLKRNKEIIKEKVIIYLAEDMFTFDARKRFKKYIKSNETILDVGAGSSPFTKGLKNKVIAIDIPPEDNQFGFSEKTLGKLRARSNIEASIMDAQKLDFPNEQFGVVIMSEVLEHIWDDRAAANEIIRVLKPGGFLFLTVPHLKRVPLDSGIKEHYRHYTMADLDELFGEEKIVYLRDRFKFNEFTWGSRFILKYNQSKKIRYLILLPYEAILKLFLTFIWLPLSEKLFPNVPGYNLIMVMQKRCNQNKDSQSGI